MVSRWVHPKLATLHKLGPRKTFQRPRRPKNQQVLQTEHEVHASRASLVFSPRPNVWRVVYKGELLQETYGEREDARAILRTKLKVLR